MRIDLAIRAWIVLHRVQGLSAALWALSAIGGFGILWMLIAAGLTIAKRLPPRVFIQLALVLAVTSTINDGVLQRFVGRERPFVALEDVPVIGNRPTSGSFPSGHTANAFASAVVLSCFAAGPAWLWWFLAGAIAYSRVYLGVHYPSDVVAGAFVGIMCAFATIAATRRRIVCPSRPRPRGRSR